MNPSNSKLVFQSHPPPPPPHPHLRCSPGCWERILPRLPRWWHPGRISPGSPPSECGTAPTLSSTPPWGSEEEEEVVREWREAAGSCGLSYSISDLLDEEWEETKISDFEGECLLEGLGSNRKNHELLHGQFVTCMGTSVYHIKGLKRRGNKGEEGRGNERTEEERGTGGNKETSRGDEIYVLAA